MRCWVGGMREGGVEMLEWADGGGDVEMLVGDGGVGGEGDGSRRKIEERERWKMVMGQERREEEQKEVERTWGVIFLDLHCSVIAKWGRTKGVILRSTLFINNFCTSVRGYTCMFLREMFVSFHLSVRACQASHVCANAYVRDRVQFFN